MTEYATGYQPISSYCDDAEDDDSVPQFQHTTDADPEAPPNATIHVVPDKSKARWNHIEDLDEFFTRVYQYHQRSGFFCMVLQDTLQLIQFLFVVIFSTFLVKCVDYEILFYEKEYNHTHKVTIAESVYSANQCFARFDAATVICITIALFFWLLRFMKVLYNIFKYYEIRCFYIGALKISNAELVNVTWHEVQLRLLDVQQEQQMCIHKQNLTQLDIYHRILRFKNYTIAMVNKDLLPLKFQVPFLGESVFLTSGLKYNLEMLLFWGPWAPFENNWHLKPEYRDHHNREILAQKLSQHILWVGITNFLLCPVIFMWQILYSFFRYAEVVKREPGSLGSRRWSLYSRLYLRHFNELDHEFNARLCRAYKPAEKYMNIFTSPVVVIIAKHVAFLAGSILAVLVILTMIDEDVLAVQHILVTMTIAGVVVTICGACIPDEHMVFCPELLLRSVLGHIHYMPDHWRGQGHNHNTRNEFAQHFQYKVVYLLEEVLSPILTPLILTFSVRHKALDIVDFFRNFTVEVTGVGDVCSFAQMDIRKHGNPKWTEDDQTEAGLHEQGENGKTELSLMHFTLTNPEWKPATPETDFLSHLRRNVQRDASSLPMMPHDNPLANSLSSINFGAPGGYTSMMSSFSPQSQFLAGPPEPPDSGPQSLLSTDVARAPMPSVRGGIKSTEGPLSGSGNGLLTSIHSNPGVKEDALEYLSTEMTFSALYIHELHHRKMRQPYFSDAPQQPSLWQQPSPSHAPGYSSNSRMPNIEEDEVELENVPIRGIWQSGKSSVSSEASAISGPAVSGAVFEPHSSTSTNS